MKQKRLLLPILFPLTLLGIFMGALQTKASPSAIFNVNSTVDAVDVYPGDGVCETAVENGVCTLRAAVQETNALPGEDTIQLGNATYLLTIAGKDEDAAATGDLDITDALTIIGNGSSLSIIDGNQLDRVLEVYFDASLTLIGTTITNGRIDTGSSGVGGGGILNSSSLNIENSSIFSNTAHTLSGGGLYNNGGAITITNSSISSNAITGNTSREGAGISNLSGSLFIESSQVKNNLGGFGNGGGISSAQTAVISDTFIINNDADNGGGLYLAGSALIVNSVISNNMSISGSEDAGLGGGIYYESAIDALEITNSTILSNTANEAGGIYISGQGSTTFTLTQSTISENLGYARGGGIQSSLASVSIVDSTIDTNTTFSIFGSDFGGGIYFSGDTQNSLTISGSSIINNSSGNAAGIFLNQGSEHQIQNSTLANNATRSSAFSFTGGAIRFQFTDLSIMNSTIAYNTSNETNNDGAVIADTDGILTVENTIIANNTGGDCTINGIAPELMGSIVSNGHNLSGDSSCSFAHPSDLINTDPMLGPLQNHGGSTVTFSPLPTSPAIDAGDNANCLATDQRGVMRPQDGDNDGTAVCDIGAVEFLPESSSTQYLYLPVIVKP